MRITTKRNYFHAFFLSLLLALVANTTISAPAHAARPFAAPPQIENFYVEPVDQFGPGVELSFTVEGTPGAQARVRIGGSNKNVSLEEVSRGVYEGSYTISRKDRISESSIVRVTLRARGLATSENYRLPPSSGSGPAAAAPAPAPAPQPAALAIERFTVTPIGKIEPGADLKFALNGTPGASASFTIENVVKDVPMREVSRGRYEGSYTIRRLDHFPAAVNILATVEAGGKAVGARLNQSLLTDARPPVVKNVAPQNGETVVAGATSISATFDDSGGVGVDAKSVRVSIGGRDVTQGSTITPQFFNYRADLPPGTYPVEVAAKDLAGNAVRHVWTFTVAPQAAPANLPLQILSHANNAPIGGGPTQVRGRTAPDATVDVQVQGIASVAGLFGVTQPVFEQSLRADGNGNFAFTFEPQFVVPGMRYEITIRAAKAGLTKDMQLVLFQQR